MSTPDQASDQQEPEARPDPQQPLQREGWGMPGHEGLPNPLPEDAAATRWFRRPAVVIGGAAVAVVVIVGLVIALVVTVNDGTDEASSATTAPAATTTAAPSVVDSINYTEETDAMFLGSVDPVLRLYASDDDLFGVAAGVCMSSKFAAKEKGKLAVITAAKQIAKWKGTDIPTMEGSVVSMPQSLADDAAELVVGIEAAYCPGTVNDGSSELLMR